MFAKYLHQKGAILILTALLLPMLICGTGLAVDLGNIYVQKTRLQNTTDAAALAGANAYAVNNEKINHHPYADDKANQYIQGDYHNLNTDENISIKKTAELHKKNVTFYNVELSKEVPLYFLKIFYDKDTFTVPAKSTAAITYKGEPSSNNPFKNLFTFTKDLTTQNVLNFDPNNKTIFTTFDGNIVYTNGTGTNQPSFRPNTLLYNNADDRDAKAFYPSETKGKNANAPDVSAKGFTAQYQNLNLYSYANQLKEKYSKTTQYSNRENDNFWLSANAIDKTEYYIKNAQQAVIDLSQNTNKISNTPINITIDSAAEPKIYINNNSSNENQPIIYTYLGKNEIKFEGSGGSFYGIIYAPYAKVYCNDNNFKFHGSIVSESIRLEANGAQYYFKDYSKYLPISGDESSSSTGSQNSGNYTVSLV
ncbi:Putative Flp pilus-assembly TadE/G-like [Selenomonas sp. GACV-9]|uniref:Tad domain-containing protein n=1 Tax=Selenomonas sp. GACV-9 TaxID=3158782 RepID=UPI0008ED8332|nr:Putative Flp pilus-assembly TadE/G-like [Selenomonas ruminantium]